MVNKILKSDILEKLKKSEYNENDTEIKSIELIYRDINNVLENIYKINDF